MLTFGQLRFWWPCGAGACLPAGAIRPYTEVADLSALLLADSVCERRCVRHRPLEGYSSSQAPSVSPWAKCWAAAVSDKERVRAL